MAWFDVNNIWMVALYPLLAFFIIVLGRAFGWNKSLFANKEISAALVLLATLLGLVHTGFALGWLFGHGADAVIERNFPWIVAGDFTLSIGYLLDSMSVMMLFVVTFISLFIQWYTRGYMSHDDGYAKFFAYLALFNFSMLGLVLSTNLFQIYIFWELVGVSSYLLIGFWFTRPDAAAASIKAFLMNRVGDFGFLFGILGLLYFSYPLWGSIIGQHPDMALLSFRALPEIVSPVAQAAGPGLFAAIAILLFMGPMAKSAQVPLHTWLPDAMAGPTPISALIHAATMVAAGVYLVGRAYPVFGASENAMAFVAIIGTLTAVIAATIALTQYDIKKALAYSTMSQLGFMVAAMGVGAFTAGLFHLFTHAFFKAMLFLCSGSVIHACEDEQDMREMGGLRKKLPVTHITYLIGCLAISGLLWTSGFWSKDMVLAGAKEAMEAGSAAAHSWPLVSRIAPFVYWSLLITAGFTAFYMFRTYFITFWGEYRGKAHVHHEDTTMITSLAVLAVPSAIIGILLSGSLKDWPAFAKLPAFGDYIHWGHAPHVHGLVAAITSEIGVTSFLVGAAGFAVALLFYVFKPEIPEKIRTAPLTSSLFTLFSKKWYFDEFYQGFVDRVYLAFARGSAEFDRRGIDGVVNWTGHSVVGSGNSLKLLQSGRIQTYIAIMFFSVFVLSLLLFYWLM